MINCAPQVLSLAIDLHEHFIEVSAAVAKTAHPRNPLAPNFRSKHRHELAPPMPNRLVANVDPTLEQQILNIAQR